MITAEKGNTKKIKATLYDENSQLVDADLGTCKVAIWFQDETIVLAATAMTWNSLGTYTYLWNIASTVSIGIYNIEVVAIFGSTQNHVNREQCFVTDIISEN